MLVIDLLLALSLLSSLASQASLYVIQKTNRRLKEENEVFYQHLLDDPKLRENRDPKRRHEWKFLSVDVVAASRLPWSYERVVIKTWLCEHCHLAHKLISEGLTLARKKELLHLEGYFFTGNRLTIDPGCFKEFPDAVPAGSTSPGFSHSSED